jgi:hypothetical protein
MSMRQFRILFRNFLFRVVDLDLLSAHAQGDANKLLGRMAAIPVMLGSALAIGLFMSGDNGLDWAQRQVAAWGMEYFFVATTMLVAGVFAILSWDSIFPSRNDVLVLAPLPVRAETMFAAKVAASGAALILAVAALNGLVSLVWPLALAPPTHGIFDLFLTLAIYRTFVAYWAAVILTGGFILGCVLCVQGVAAQLLPRKTFLRASSWLQIGLFVLLVSVFFLQPWLTTPEALAASENQRALLWIPSYWFLGLFQELNGSMHPVMEALARRAWIGSAVVTLGAAVTYLLSYFRTLRQIIEEPDITAGSRRLGWLPRFGSSLDTGIVQFSIRTLLRSRQHRLVLAFYVGIGFAFTVLALKTPEARRVIFADRQHISPELIASSIVILVAWIVGTRVVFSIPLDLRANWVFRMTLVSGPDAFLRARRRALVALSLGPVWMGWAALFLGLWPGREAAWHVAILGLLGALIAEVCLRGAQKIPFTCSWLPGRSNFHIAFGVVLWLGLVLINQGVRFELRAIGDAHIGAATVAGLAVAIVSLRYLNAADARSEGAELRFEDEMTPAVMELGLSRDGAFMVE